MKPESRIKLIRSLEEIKRFEQDHYDSISKRIYTLGTIVFYFIIVFFAFDLEPKHKLMFIVLMVIPTLVSTMWILFRKTIDGRHKLLVNTVLELGSIAQETGEEGDIASAVNVKRVNDKNTSPKRKKK